MTGIRTPLYTACAAIALTLGLTTVAMAEPTAPVTLTEWDVPWKSTRPRDPWPQNDTTIWFSGVMPQPSTRRLKPSNAMTWRKGPGPIP